jgi:hypothetical protein
MIVFDLLCSTGHRFEGWFGSSKDFESQRERKLLSCPTCDSAKVERVPSAARLNFGAQPPAPKPQVPAKAPEKTPEMETKDPFAIGQMLYSKMLDELLTKTEDVGKEFPKEARRIFYGEAAERAIRGQATQEQHDELIEEGIPVARFPVPKPEGMN